MQLHAKDGVVESVTVDMGEPVLEAAEIPVLSDKHPVIGETVEIFSSYNAQILHQSFWIVVWAYWMFRYVIQTLLF